MIRLQSHVCGRFVDGVAAGRSFVDPVTGETLGMIDSTGVDCAGALDHARRVGGAALAALSFAERGALLGRIAEMLSASRDTWLDIARRNSGNTARDASIDVDGGLATLKYYARLAEKLGAAKRLIEPGSDRLAKGPFEARHVWSTRPGAAILINAFNFPAWGLWEKVAVALVAGMPVVAKPASGTAWLAEAMVRAVVEAGVLPDGALSLICGSAEGLLDAVEPFDCIAFTGSADTGRMIRSHPAVLAANPRLGIEADSVNVALLAPSATAEAQAFERLLEQALAAVSVKAGQLCTNIRRILVPSAMKDAFVEALASRIDGLVVGDPALPEVTVGPLVDEKQLRAAFAGLAALASETRTARGGGLPKTVVGADPAKGAFLAPTLLVADTGATLSAVHDVEVFGPVVTVIPYRDLDEAIGLAARGEGSLAASVYGDDAEEAGAIAARLAPYHGRVLTVDVEVGRSHTGHAIVMPQCVHGGPGRAGGGEELGGLRGLRFFMQRTAIQGSPTMLAALAADAVDATL
ncbi:MAG: 3,4-dehydroadipyl-CoA semialdehyde dehydrogenase [Hyphomicrobiales bacterium]|nr:3,4-dehydroadipyl-CoA semialdehyde dehydrogenase [Hyphomicrobiales bacterium]